MQAFINHIMPYISEYVLVRLSASVQIDLKKEIVKRLGFRNETDLKTKHEGFRFYDSYTRDILGLFAIEKYLGNEIVISEETLKKELPMSMEINNCEYKYLVFNFGEIPIIDKTNTKPCILICRKESLSFYLCGIAFANVLNKFQDDKVIKNTVYSANKTGFIGFNHLKSISTLRDEL